MEKIFDLVFGLPLHPLIDHVVVIFIPIFSLALIASFFVENVAKKYGFLIQIGLAIGFVSAFIAEQSGEALSLRVGTPIQHAELGENLVLISLGSLISSAAWFYLKKQKNKVLEKIVGVVAVLLAVAAIVFTVLTGHTGAKAVWDEKINPKPVAQEMTTNETVTSESGVIELNAQEVSRHNYEKDCWSIIDKKVYNLTNYVSSHPGGVVNIVNICGKDGSSLFQGQHGNDSKPNNVLSGFLLGNLGESLTSLPNKNAPNNEVVKENENSEYKENDKD